MSLHFRNYCEECEWSASTETHGRGELAVAAIEHAIETDHDIDSEMIADFSAAASDESGAYGPVR